VTGPLRRGRRPQSAADIRTTESLRGPGAAHACIGVERAERMTSWPWSWCRWWWLALLQLESCVEDVL